MKIEKNFYGYDVVVGGDDAGRFATSEVAPVAYADELYGYISDASKDAQGFRVRFNYRDMSFAELEEQCDFWSQQVTIAIENERIQEESDLAEFKELIQKTIEAGAGDEDTAIRWLMQTEEFYNSQDVEHWVWERGILFTDYGRDLVKKLKNIVEYVEIA